jgi:hypothetical protein
MNYKLAMNIVGELKILLQFLESPDARWDSLQVWLKTHPRWGKPVNRYVNCTPAEALADLRQFIIDETEVPEVLLAVAITPQIEQQAKRSIERLQTMYKERKAEDSQPRAYAGDEWVVDNSLIPSGHKSINDYQRQLKAKKKRKKRKA